MAGLWGVGAGSSIKKRMGTFETVPLLIMLRGLSVLAELCCVGHKIYKLEPLLGVACHGHAHTTALSLQIRQGARHAWPPKTRLWPAYGTAIP